MLSCPTLEDKGETMAIQQRDIKKSFRLPAELYNRATTLLKRDKFKIYSFSDITILALDEFLKKFDTNPGQTENHITEYMASVNESTSAYGKNRGKNGRQKK
jgi:hypothetical protein